MNASLANCIRSALAVAALAGVDAAAAARLDPVLESRLSAAGANTPLEVIVSFEGDGPPAPDDLALLQSLGLRGITLHSLPIAGVLATRAQVDALLADDDVRSVWFNAPLAYENEQATALTSVDRLRTEPLLRNNGLPFSGRGIGVLVNDSGVDGTHADIRYPDHVVQNVAAQTKVEVITWAGHCEVHERFTTDDIERFRLLYPGVIVLAEERGTPGRCSHRRAAGSQQQQIEPEPVG